MRWFKHKEKGSSCAQTGGHNVTPALAEYGIAKKLMEGREAVEEYYVPLETERGTYFPRELTALDVIKCVLSVALFLLVCYYGGVQHGK